MKTEFIYEDLSRKLIGLAYEVHNALGFGLKEKAYTDAFEELLKQEGLTYQRECYYPIKIREAVIGRRYFDFLVEGKIIVEFKVGSSKYYEAFNQLLEYLKHSNLKLGLILRLTQDGVKVKRIVNIY